MGFPARQETCHSGWRPPKPQGPSDSAGTSPLRTEVWPTPPARRRGSFRAVMIYVFSATGGHGKETTAVGFATRTGANDG
ncbi:MAG: hypothetical protein RLZZ458_1652 [Planctomycetota bacterium]